MAVLMALCGSLAAAMRGEDTEGTRAAWDDALVIRTRPNYTIEEPQEQHLLRAELRGVPPNLAVGAELTMTVRLSNPTDVTIELIPCPWFRLVVGESATLAEVLALVPCDEVGRLGPQEHLDLEMRIPLETAWGAPLVGDSSVVWQLWGNSQGEPLVQDYAGVTIG